jgi:Major Facilitator Superfamily
MSVQQRALADRVGHISQLPPPLILAWLVWGLGATAYFIGFYQRVAPAVITQELSQAFTLTAAGLGNLSAFYFYSYVAMQIPTGLLADRFGPRILLTVGCVIAAIGTAIFAVAQDVMIASLGRLLIGGSIGVAFVSMLKIASHWMPARQFALASSLALAVGVFGAVFAGAPLRLMVDEWGWRGVMWVSAVLTVFVAAASWWLVRDDPREKGYASFADHGTETASKRESESAGLSQCDFAVFLCRLDDWHCPHVCWLVGCAVSHHASRVIANEGSKLVLGDDGGMGAGQSLRERHFGSPATPKDAADDRHCHRGTAMGDPDLYAHAVNNRAYCAACGNRLRGGQLHHCFCVCERVRSAEICGHGFRGREHGCDSGADVHAAAGGRNAGSLVECRERHDAKRQTYI